MPWWWNGRHRGLKIPSPMRAWGFESPPGYLEKDDLPQV